MGSDWISTLLAKLGELWPWTKIDPWETGIITFYIPAYRDWRGKLIESRTIIKARGPGVHFTPWYYSRITKVDTRALVMDLQVQTITTRDAKSISFSVNIEYEIIDGTLAQTAVQHLGSSLEATCRNHLARRVRSMEFLGLLAKQDDLEKSLRGTLSSRAAKWGVKITDVGFTDMTESTTQRLLGDAVLHVSQDVTTYNGSKSNED